MVSPADPVAVTVELSANEAWALAQLLKRIGLADYRALAADEAEARVMQAAGDRLRRALADRGIAPR